MRTTILPVIISITALATILTACNSSQPPVADSNIKPAEPVIAAVVSPGIAVNKNKQAYFGNVHVHTSWSFDGYTNGSRTNPDDAYRWAQGQAIPGGGGGGELKIKKPLDFYAVSEHAEYMGVFAKMGDPTSPISKLPIAKEITSDDQGVAFAAFAKVLDGMNKGVAQPELSDPVLAKSLWEEVVEIADRHNKPGIFTTFPAFEWTSAPDNRNLHRVVLFKNSQHVPELAFSTLDSNKPEDLWRYMDTSREQGATLFAIPHNANASDGLMFSGIDSEGKSLDADYALTRMRNEPLYEISQIKGTSETHPKLSPNDEFAGFEQWEYTLSAITERNTKQHGSYLRQAYLDGLALDSAGLGNPFKYGIIGDSDTHNSASAIEEDNYTGKFAIENSPKHRLMGALPVESNNKQLREFSSGGLAGVWAESNTREAIFDAMLRKETFGTSGTRMKVRMFASWGFDKNILESADWLTTAYQKGVPMGGDLLATYAGIPPVFVVTALKEVDGANLDRIQIVKGWVENGKSYEKIYNVALSNERKLDSHGNAPAVGNTVDAKTASYSNSIGAVELKVVWKDPDFDYKAHAFYYARVLEIPTPRWSTYDAMKLGIAPRDDLPVSIQERAWTSPIWYTPQY